jgi:hypothetical protein
MLEGLIAKMKFVVQDLRVGEITTAKITEILSETEVIMSFAGDLLRVQNLSRRHLRVGDIVQCRVTQVQPLRFELARAQAGRSGRATPKMDRLI